MGLYWKDIEIKPGLLIEMDFIRHEAFNEEGSPVRIQWEVLSFGTRNSDNAYIDYHTGKKYSMNEVFKKKKLQAKIERNELLQLPSGTDFMIVQVFHDGEKAYRRCYNLDMLQTVRNIRVIHH